jgi:hypothetical protein
MSLPYGLYVVAVKGDLYCERINGVETIIEKL